ncbi:hypothetical protein [Enemella dayhoffiae]|uniref:hypothetical protein n=1 Tax=Enemella dayhoffiae TaxID=2016507 RepID=UPI001140630A|nr:hypothetical protein [Enemella dayhoffiae]
MPTRTTVAAVLTSAIVGTGLATPLAMAAPSPAPGPATVKATTARQAPTVSLTTPRSPHEAVTVYGYGLTPNTQVKLAHGAANTDEAVDAGTATVRSDGSVIHTIPAPAAGWPDTTALSLQTPGGKMLWQVDFRVAIVSPEIGSEGRLTAPGNRSEPVQVVAKGLRPGAPGLGQPRHRQHGRAPDRGRCRHCGSGWHSRGHRQRPGWRLAQQHPDGHDHRGRHHRLAQAVQLDHQLSLTWPHGRPGPDSGVGRSHPLAG